MSDAILGGLLIGLASTFLFLSIGEIAGFSGIIARCLDLNFKSSFKENLWRFFFLLGLFISSYIYSYINLVPNFDSLPPLEISSSTLNLFTAGVLVGFGTSLGNGCTSGHGVCGLARLSKRSFVAVVVFMFFAALVVNLVELIYA